MEDILLTITELSHEFGTPDYVKAGGGNTSCKNETVMWVKPSGTTLAGLTPETFVKMNRKKLAKMYTARMPANATEREAKVKALMTAAVLPDTPGRASVEASLHDSLSATFVVHTHPMWVNGLTCALGGQAAAEKLFPDALFLPYIDPGYTLCMAVRKAVAEYAAKNGHEPRLLLLGNHGVFVAANTAKEIRSIYANLRKKLFAAYKRTDVSDTLATGPAPDKKKVNAWKAVIKKALGEDGACVAACGRFCTAAGPITPDHIVYSKSYFFQGVPTADNLRAFQAERGYAPRVIVLPDAVLGVGKNEKTAQLALALAQDGAQIKQFSAAFAGIRYLSDASRSFIENWEVEAFRAKNA